MHLDCYSEIEIKQKAARILNSLLIKKDFLQFSKNILNIFLNKNAEIAMHSLTQDFIYFYQNNYNVLDLLKSKKTTCKITTQVTNRNFKLLWQQRNNLNNLIDLNGKRLFPL